MLSGGDLLKEFLFSYLGVLESEFENGALSVGDVLVTNDDTDLILMGNDGDFIVVNIDFVFEWIVFFGNEIDFTKLFFFTFFEF